MNVRQMMRKDAVARRENPEAVLRARLTMHDEAVSALVNNMRGHKLCRFGTFAQRAHTTWIDPRIDSPVLLQSLRDRLAEERESGGTSGAKRATRRRPARR